MSEVKLESNEHRSITRIDNTIHRPTHWWTRSVHDLLNYLEKVGFPYSPRVIGFDNEGREILTYIEGESGKEGWFKIHSDEGLANFAKLLKSYHEAVAGYKPHKDAEWAYSPNTLKPGEIICHGDFAPWNIAWNGDKPVGLLDWDFVLPAKPEYDILYALEYAAPFRSDERTLKEHHFTEVPDRKRRIQIFLESYGTDLSDVTHKVAQVQRQAIAHVKYLADHGLQPQVDWVKSGMLDNIEKQAQWSEENAALFK